MRNEDTKRYLAELHDSLYHPTTLSIVMGESWVGISSQHLQIEEVVFFKDGDINKALVEVIAKGRKAWENTPMNILRRKRKRY